jgi:hypothetical protein
MKSPWQRAVRNFVLTAAAVFALAVIVRSQTDVIVPSDRVVNAVNVREGPTTSSAIVGKLRPGEQASLLLDVPSWYRIRLSNGVEGFVSKAWTDRLSPPPTPSPTTASADPAFKVHFLDVGTGDSAIVDIGDHEIIIDGGDSTTVLPQYVAARDIIDGPVELVVVTHGDSDHWKGLNRLLNFDNLGANPPQVLEVWDAGYDRTCNPASNGGRSPRHLLGDSVARGGLRARRSAAVSAGADAGAGEYEDAVETTGRGPPGAVDQLGLCDLRYRHAEVGRREPGQAGRVSVSGERSRLEAPVPKRGPGKKRCPRCVGH